MIISTIPVSSKLITKNKQRKREYVWVGITGKGITEYKRDLGRYSRKCTYHKYEYYYYVNSVGSILNKGKTLLYIDWNHKTYKFKAPQGWKWGKDNLGIKLYKVRTNIDIHVNASLLLNNTVSNLVTLAISNYKKRIQQNYFKATSLLHRYNLKLSDIYVFREDSYNSGNCKVGTDNFIKTHNINSVYVPANTLPRTYHTEKAICAAIIRTIDEIERGYCYSQRYS